MSCLCCILAMSAYKDYVSMKQTPSIVYYVLLEASKSTFTLYLSSVETKELI
jgi:hypothetical protein